MSLMFLPHVEVFFDPLLNRCMAAWNLFVLYNNETNVYRKNVALFLSNYFIITLKLAFAYFDLPFVVSNFFLYKMKQSHWSLCVAKNYDWSRKIMPLSNLKVVSHRMKTYSKSRIELRNLQILKKINAGRVKSAFVIRAALWAEKHGPCIQYCRS